MRATPQGLYGLLFAEFWERFSYFAALSIFALYLNERLHLSESRASVLAGTFAALAYLTPLVGGWLADRVLGSRRALVTGTAVLGIGYAMLMHASPMAAFWAVALLALGSGLFKPNITACIGNLFDRIDCSGRQAAFRALYLWINLAAAVAPPAIGAIQSRLGWPAAFGACALSILVCLCAIMWTRGSPPVCAATKSRTSSSGQAVVDARALAALCLPAMAFFAVFGQSLGALLFWVRDRVDLTLGGWLASPLTPAATCAVIPCLTVALLPTVEPLRRLLGRLQLVRSVSGELKLALVLSVLSLFVLMIPEAVSLEGSRINAGWLLASYVLLTLSELLIVPLSLSLVEALAPPGRGATYTGVFYLGVAAGSQLGGEVARLWGILAAPLYFLLVALIPLVACGALAVLGSALDRRQSGC